MSVEALHPLTGKAREAFRQADAQGNLWEGSVRAGKTVSSLLRWIAFIRQAPPGDLLMIGRTERTIKRNIIDLMIKWCGSDVVKYAAGSGELKLFGRLVYVAGANDDRSAEKIQGMTLIGFYGDELSTWPESMFNMARSRLSLDGAMWFGTTNPAGPSHWLKVNWIDRAGLQLTRDGQLLRLDGPDTINMSVFSFTLDDNPHLSSAFVNSIKREYVGMFYRRYILGEWCLAEGAIYDMWDPDRHVVEPARVPPIYRWVSAGVDHGTRNPFHAVLLGVGARQDGQPGMSLYATDEYRYDSRAKRKQMSDAEYSVAYRSWLKAVRVNGEVAGVAPEYTCVDPSATGFRVQLHHDGVATAAADNRVDQGIMTTGSLFSTGRLYVSSRCKELIKEIPGYSWDERSAKLGIDSPIKVNDHGCDALRYGIKTPEAIWRPMLYPTGQGG